MKKLLLAAAVALAGFALTGSQANADDCRYDYRPRRHHHHVYRPPVSVYRYSYRDYHRHHPHTYRRGPRAVPYSAYRYGYPGSGFGFGYGSFGRYGSGLSIGIGF